MQSAFGELVSCHTHLEPNTGETTVCAFLEAKTNLHLRGGSPRIIATGFEPWT